MAHSIQNKRIEHAESHPPTHSCTHINYLALRLGGMVRVIVHLSLFLSFFRVLHPHPHPPREPYTMPKTVNTPQLPLCVYDFTAANYESKNGRRDKIERSTV